ncbi:MAG TPA: hypothetical protein VMU50_04175 [Polyangia bacterium]|nr:hypothetical protein [Polyangia bacterium]
MAGTLAMGGATAVVAAAAAALARIAAAGIVSCGWSAVADDRASSAAG